MNPENSTEPTTELLWEKAVLASRTDKGRWKDKKFMNEYQKVRTMRIRRERGRKPRVPKEKKPYPSRFNSIEEYKEFQKEQRHKYYLRFYAKNKDKIKEQTKAYYDKKQANKPEPIPPPKVHCDLCNVDVFEGNLPRHNDSWQHRLFEDAVKRHSQS